MNILILDTETAPNQVDTWGLFNQNVAINQIRKPGHLLCFAAKWLDRPQDEVIFDSVLESGRESMAKHLHALLSDADVVVGYNSVKFDTKVINTEIVLAGLTPPPPFKQVDLLRTMRGNFRFASNKLDFISQQLGLGKKTSHMGHALWTACESGDKEAWALMEKYNRQDVLLTEELYRKVLPWIKNHPNRASYAGAETPMCPRCGSGKLERRGTERTVANAYQRYKCTDCGSWSRSPVTENRRQDREKITRAL